jgi:iron complex outermembrane receptor protein
MKTLQSAMFLSAMAAAIYAAPALSQVQLEEVIVTAQKRAQSAQDVPVAVTAVDATMLHNNNINNVFDLAAAVPTLRVSAVDPPGQGTSYSLRGLGNSVFNMGFDPAVATFVDGVYRSRSGLLASSDFVDLERVEVLLGPQGTLFGKNTTAGVVSFVSKKPTFDAFNGFAEMSFEDYQRTRLRGTFNVPVSDTLAFRLSGSYAEGDGWLKLINSGESIHNLHRWAMKAQMLWQPTDAFSLHVTADTAQVDEKCCWVMRLQNDPNTVTANSALAVLAGSGIVSPPNLNNLVSEANQAPLFSARDRGISAQIDWKLPIGTLTSITAYRHYEDSANKDNDFTGVDILRSNQNLPVVRLGSEELRLAGTAGPVDWLVGGFYSKERIEVTNEFIWASQVGYLLPFLAPGRAYLATFGQDIKSQALFAHGTYKFTDQLRLTVGGRWSKDDKDGTLVNDQPPGGFLPFAVLPLAVVYDYDAHTSDSKPTYTASLQYDIVPDMMAYATFSHGYKSGGISMTRDAAGSALFLGFGGCPPGSVAVGGPFCSSPKADPTFRPELADNVEVGLKSELLNRRVRLNFAAWQTKFKDLQWQILRPADGAFAVTNIAGATSQGFSVEGDVAVTAILRVNAVLEYVDAKFDNDVGVVTPGLPAFGGQRLTQSSEWTGNLGFNIKKPVSGTWNLNLSGNAYFRSSYFPGDPGPGLAFGGYALYNARFGVDNGHWDVAAWCRNCSDKRYIYSNFQIPFDGTILGASTRFAHVPEPRIMGLSAGYRF